MTALGREVLAEFWDAESLDDPEVAEAALRKAVEAGGATLINVFVHQFSPHGITGLAIIAESHLALHTWPEHGYAAVDVFTCGNVDFDAMLQVLIDTYRPKRTEQRALLRGVRPERAEGVA